MDGNKPEPHIVKGILLTSFSVHCHLIGSENLDDICFGHDDFMDDNAIFHMDAGDSLAFLANAATIVGLAWQIISACLAKGKPQPSSDEIDKIIIAVHQKSTSLSQAQRLEIYINIDKRLKDESN
ncbi:hypothetical protein M2352_001501 [Azospirillum fermentarium]|uniref:hypothetical protein n=1 Tax=Azospirillum fermentarium TaxID=1233114 RepID=UPI002227900F|nr:hypothetical protein [Azospirillum fermentarium]MCW2245910.1 hypothetical protein [Azospirillum fermentarium]